MLIPALAFLYGVMFGALLWAALTAPEGYEDETGFHFGRPPE